MRPKLGDKRPQSAVKSDTGGMTVLTELKAGPRVVGAKQTRRAVNDGRALRVFLAKDADPNCNGSH